MTDHLNELSTDTGCPKCGSENVTPVKFTWWGGLLGPKMFHHTKCNACGYTYNAKTRQSNTTAIVIYSVVGFIVVFGLVFWLMRMQSS